MRHAVNYALSDRTDGVGFRAIFYVLSARLSAPLRALHYTLTAFSPWRCAIMNRSHTRGKAIPKFTDQERFSCARAANCRSATSLALFSNLKYTERTRAVTLCKLYVCRHAPRPSGPTSSRSAAVRRAVRGGALAARATAHGRTHSSGRTPSKLRRKHTATTAR